MPNQLWHYTIDRNQFGPVPEEEIVEMLKSSRLRPDALVWTDGLPSWVSIASIPAFRPHLPIASSTPPALPSAFPPPLRMPDRVPPAMGGSFSSFSEAPPNMTYAGFWKRLAASFLDGIVLMVIMGIVRWGIKESSQVDDPLALSIASFIPNCIVGWLYYILQEASGAQGTLGKKALGLKVVDLHGGRISFGQATGRYFGKMLSGLLLCIGFLMVAFDDRKQGLHDKMAGTLVIDHRA